MRFVFAHGGIARPRHLGSHDPLGAIHKHDQTHRVVHDRRRDAGVVQASDVGLPFCASHAIGAGSHPAGRTRLRLPRPPTSFLTSGTSAGTGFPLTGKTRADILHSGWSGHSDRGPSQPVLTVWAVPSEHHAAIRRWIDQTVAPDARYWLFSLDDRTPVWGDAKHFRSWWWKPS